MSVHWVCLVKQIKCDEENVATDRISQHEPPDNTSVMDYIPCQLLGIPVHILLTITFTLYLSDHFILTCTQLSLSLFLITSSWHAHNYHFHSIFLITSSWHAHNYHFHSLSFWSLHLDMHTIITFTLYLSDHFILTCTQLSLSLSIFLITSSWHAHSYHFHSIFLITSSWHAHSYHFHSLSFWSLHLDMHTVITFTIFLITSSWHAHNYHFHSLSFWSLHLDMHNFFSWDTKHQFCKSVETPSKKVNFS